jgi:error-prone DNA polymerase
LGDGGGSLRPVLQARQMVTCADLKTIRDGRRVVVPGIVLVRQKPGSAKGVMFITIEDETGVVNLILWKDRFEAQRRLVCNRCGGATEISVDS